MFYACRGKKKTGNQWGLEEVERLKKIDTGTDKRETKRVAPGKKRKHPIRESGAREMQETNK